MKILFCCNDLNFFAAHRLFLAERMQNKGHSVQIAIEETADESRAKKFKLIRLPLDRYRFAPLKDLKLLFAYYTVIKKHQPTIVHAITIKPILFISIVMLFLQRKNKPKLVCTFPGLGKIFENEPGLYNFFRKQLVTSALRFCQSRNKAFATFENTGNRKTMIENHIVTDDASAVLMGAGIGDQFTPRLREKSQSVVSFAGRLLRAKGIGLFIDAAEKLRKAGYKAEFLVAGEWDKNNPDSIDLNIVKDADKAGIIRYVGNIPSSEVHEFLQGTDIFCLPSMLNEGLPRAMLEAAACGCALIVSDQVSTRPFVKDDITGYRLTPVTSDQICSVLEPMLQEKEKARKMGENAAELVDGLPIREDQIFDEFLAIYEREIAKN